MARLGVAYVPEGRGIFPNLSVRENLVMAARRGRDGRDDWTLRARARDLPAAEGAPDQPRRAMLGLMPHSLLRPIVMLALMAGVYVAGYPMNATTAMLAIVTAIWLTTLLQLMVLGRRLAATVEAGPKRYDVKSWLAISLPMLAVWGFYTLLTTTDVLVLQQFRPADEVAHYFAAAKTLTLVTFVYFAVVGLGRSPLRRLSRRRRPRRARGVGGKLGALDLLAVARGDAADPCARQADAVAVRARASPTPIR